MHGSLQAGYNGGLAPLCIGSHYAVRTRALKEIGGLGPELAEDHSTTLMMNAGGWRGVHAMEAIAHGDGPRTFASLVTQEFQWSRSLVTLLMQYSPRLVGSLPPRLKFQFLFSQLWYPLFSIFMAVMFAMPIIALLRGENFVEVTYPAFLAHFAPLSLILVLMAWRWRAGGTFRPVDASILSWEAMLFLFARWPWALLGTAAAVRDWLTGSFVDFRVTPKGASEVDPLPLRVLAPYAFLSLTSTLAVLAVSDAGDTRGFYLFAIFNAVLYSILLVVILIQHARENAVKKRPGISSVRHGGQPARTRRAAGDRDRRARQGRPGSPVLGRRQCSPVPEPLFDRWRRHGRAGTAYDYFRPEMGSVASKGHALRRKGASARDGMRIATSEQFKKSSSPQRSCPDSASAAKLGNTGESEMNRIVKAIAFSIGTILASGTVLAATSHEGIAPSVPAQSTYTFRQTTGHNHIIDRFRSV